MALGLTIITFGKWQKEDKKCFKESATLNSDRVNTEDSSVAHSCRCTLKVNLMGQRYLAILNHGELPSAESPEQKMKVER